MKKFPFAWLLTGLFLWIVQLSASPQLSLPDCFHQVFFGNNSSTICWQAYNCQPSDGYRLKYFCTDNNIEQFEIDLGNTQHCYDLASIFSDMNNDFTQTDGCSSMEFLLYAVYNGHDKQIGEITLDFSTCSTLGGGQTGSGIRATIIPCCD